MNRYAFLFHPLSAALGALVLWSAAVQAAPTLEVFPPSATLHHKRDSQSFVVRLNREDGTHVDVTPEALWSLEDPGKAAIQKNRLTPKAEGSTRLKVAWKGLSASVPVTVKNPGAEPAVSFRLDVMPVFMKAECNRCHGSARGQDGFKLSLWGFDPEADYFRITREIPGRRINLALPEESLLLTKSDGEAAHTGGKRFEKNSPPYQTLLRWIQAGAPNDPKEVAQLEGVELFPPSLVLEGRGRNFRLSVRARFSDGTTRDVTSTALFLSNNESTARIAPNGTLTTGIRGEAFVMARYGAFTVGTQVIVLPENQRFQWPAPPETQEIDRLVNAKLRKLRMLPSPPCDDLTFLRRAHIDIAGTLPAPERVQSFAQDSDPAKREKLVDELLQKGGFVDLWTLKWADLLQIRSPMNQAAAKNVHLYHRWLRAQLLAGVPVNEIAAQLLSASGSNLENPAANFYSIETDTLRVTEDAAQALMGIRIQCAQCHNHPFDRWTMSDYRGFMAFFTQVGRKPGEDPREKIIFNAGTGEAIHPVGGKPVPPKFPDGIEPDVKGKDRREVLAQWLADPANPWFARHMANLVWEQFMGVGIIDPVDDVRVSNPASNPELLDYLARRLVEQRFDIRSLAREICLSAAYQRSSQPNKSNALDTRNFAKSTVRRMRAEVLLDAIADATDSPPRHPSMTEGVRAVEMADVKRGNYFLNTFGKSTRETVCARAEVSPTLSQALHLLTGSTVESYIRGSNLVGKRLDAGVPPQDILAELYLRTLGRPPAAEESAALARFLDAPGQWKAALEDIQWALLNSKEFLFNH